MVSTWMRKEDKGSHEFSEKQSWSSAKERPTGRSKLLVGCLSSTFPSVIYAVLFNVCDGGCNRPL